jgi:hypothetical protein
MIKRIIISLFTTILLTSTALASDDRGAFEESCTQWAKEDGIIKSEMANYIESCLAQLKADDEQFEIAGNNSGNFEEIEGNNPQFEDDYYQDTNNDAAWGKDGLIPMKKIKE